MAKACFVTNKKTNEIEKVSAANGKESKLFSDLDKLLGNKNAALNAWMTTYTDDFIDWFGDSKAVDVNGEPLLLYLDKNNTDNSKLKFTKFPNNEPVYVNSSIVEDGVYTVESLGDIKPLLSVNPEFEKINFNVNNPDEFYENVTLATRDGHSNLIQYKIRQKNIVRNRIAKIKNSKKQIESAKASSPEQKQRFKDLLQTAVKVELRLNKTLSDIENELQELTENKTLKSLKSVAEADFQRLDYLMNKPGTRTASELIEINQIVDFYHGMNMEKGKTHSIYGENFSTSELYNEIDKVEKDLYNELYLKANVYQNKIAALEQERVTKIVNENSQFKNIKDQEFSYEDITKSLIDINWVDKFVMDITMGIFSEDSVLPDVSLAILQDDENKELAISRKQVERIEKLSEKAKEGLGDASSEGIFFNKKIKSWDIFKQIDEFGNNTGDLIYRYATKFFNDRNVMEDDFDYKITEARNIVNPAQRQKALNKALEERKKWYLKNTIQINPSLIPEIIEEFKNNPLFESGATQEQIDAHIKELKDNLGENGYKEEIAKQKRLVKKFLLNAEVIKKELKDNKKEYDKYLIQNSPFIAIEYSNSVGNTFGIDMLPRMEYNISIPRKNTAKLSTKNKKYVVSDTDNKTDYYDANFNKIDGNTNLYNFYTEMMSILKEVKEGFPVEIQDKLNVNSIPAFKKAFNEITAESVGPLDKFLKGATTMWRNLGEIFTVGIENQINHAKINYITGKTNYEVNSSFLSQNLTTINNIANAEYELFKKEYERNGDKLPSGKIALSSVKDTALEVLAHNLNLTNGELSKVKSKLPESFSPKVFFKSAAQHKIAENKSFDLPRVLKMYSELGAKYRSRVNSKPIIDLLKSHYDSIKDASLTKVAGRQSNSDDERKNAKARYQNWYNRVVLLNFDREASIDLTDEFTGDDKKSAKNWLQKTQAVINGDKTTFNRILNQEEKRLKETLTKLVSDEKDSKKIKEYQDKINSLGRQWTITSTIDGLLSAIRTKNLGWNVSSSITNYTEGEASNLILAAQGDYFSEENYWRAKGIVTRTFASESPLLWKDANKLKKLMKKVDILQDSANELQKSSDVSEFSTILDNLHPMELNRRTEYVIQSPVFVSMLLEQKITDVNGENETSVWDAMDEKGNLRPPYNTADNINSWENMNTLEFRTFKTRVESAINQAHGNYNTNRGMLIKDNVIGRAFSMFKTWLPNALYSRFAVPQDNLLGGIKGYKGRYHSFTAPSSALFFGSLGFMTGGVGAAAMAGLGGSILWTNTISNKWMQKHGQKKPIAFSGPFGYIQDLAYSSMILLQKSIGMPIQRILSIAKVDSNLVSKFGSRNYESRISETFTERDAKNMSANMTELALALQKIAMMIMVHATFWGEDDDEDDPDRQAYNLLMNKIDASLQTITQYNANITALGEAAVPAAWKTIKDIGKIGDAYTEWSMGNDIYTTGIYRGESKLGVAISKTFLPGILKDVVKGEPFGLGLRSQTERIFNPKSFSKKLKYYDETEEQTRKRENKQKRATEKGELVDKLITKFEERKNRRSTAQERKKIKNQISAYLLKKYPSR